MCEEKQASADVQETALAELDKNILLILLKDRSTGKNILWATDDYKDLGIGFAADDEITLPAITGAHGNLIKPRALKSKEEQGARTRNMAEVFTPLWICNKQNNLADNAWFGRENVFNTENGTDWQATEGKIAFPSEKGADGWIAYIASKRLEITCGEAPYLASRYDTMTGEIVPLAKRIGLLDRKTGKEQKNVGWSWQHWLCAVFMALNGPAITFCWQGKICFLLLPIITLLSLAMLWTWKCWSILRK